MWPLDCIERLGWAEDPSPVEGLADLAAELGIRALWVKRDDALGPLHGGTKTRKLDYLLAAEPWASAERWASVGAIGSGHLAAVVAAGRKLCRAVDAHVFFEPLSRGVEDNLAFTALGADRLCYAGGPVRMGLRYPALFVGARLDGAVVIPAGGSVAPANVGLVRAGLELAEQVRAGDAPAPDRVYVALGSGGTAVGLAVGLALGGLRAEVHGVDVVGRPVVTRARLRHLRRALLDWLRDRGVQLPPGFAPPMPVIRRGFLGRGYGIPTDAGVAAADRLRNEGVPAEDVYTGKALACLFADAPELADRVALFWMTARADDPLLTSAETTFGQAREPAGETTFGQARGPWGAAETPGWRDRLPPALRRRLERDPTGALAIRRRRLLALGLGVGVVALGIRRLGGYELAEPWRGQVLSRREAAIVAAAAAALVPAVPGEPLTDGPSWLDIAGNVDRFLVGAPKPMLRDVRGMLALVEQGTGLGGALPRLTRLEPTRAREALEGLAARGPLLGQAVRGLRDLCMVGTWQDPGLWPAIGYDGPTIAPAEWQFSRGRDVRPRPPSRYDHLVAPPRSIPNEDA